MTFKLSGSLQENKTMAQVDTSLLLFDVSYHINEIQNIISHARSQDAHGTSNEPSTSQVAAINTTWTGYDLRELYISDSQAIETHDKLSALYSTTAVNSANQSPDDDWMELISPPICQLAPGCTSPLEATTTSIRRHLRLHGHIHKERQKARCPWAGCSQIMRWTNVARHIKERHLGVKIHCEICGKAYRRKETLAAHANSCMKVFQLWVASQSQ